MRLSEEGPAPCRWPRAEVTMKEFLLVDAPHPSTIDEELLLRHCKLEFGRGTGPGGQRRKKSPPLAKSFTNQRV